jgi:hypothetical protein
MLFAPIYRGANGASRGNSRFGKDHLTTGNNVD